MQQLAKGIASLGRNNDSQLVHMTPGEVQGLQKLAMSHGGSLTINPHTGLVEAGFLDDVLGFAAPIVGGMMFGPIGAGIASGLTSYAKTGDMGKALGAGALGWGGASLLGGLEGAGGDVLSDATRTAAQNSGQDFMAQEALRPNSIMPDAQSEFNGFGGTGSNPYAPSSNPQYSLDPAATGDTTRNLAYSGTPDIATPAMPSYTDKIGAGFKQVTSSGQNALDFVKNNKNALLATGVGLAGMMTPKQADPVAPTLQGTRQDYAYNQPKYDASGRLISAPSYRQIGSTPYYNAAGGEIRGMAQGGVPVGPYGGSTAGPYEHSTKSEKQKMKALADLFALYSRGQGDPRMATQMAAQGGIMGMADGGYTSSATAHEAPQFTFNPANQTYAQQAPASQGSGNPFADAPSQILRALGGQFSEPAAKQYTYDPSGQKYTEKMAVGGIASLPNEYAAGGKLLQGPGDGMSDSIPAVIKGARPQRAALAQGEFVVPADVVSHLGNGSTDAGAKRLYAMMDKIRHARTGNKKQGKQINPSQFLPA